MQDFSDKELIYFNDCVAYFGKPGQKWDDTGTEQVFYNCDDTELKLGITFQEFYAFIHSNNGDVFVKCVSRIAYSFGVCEPGWRLLKVGEVIAEGDEFLSDDFGWTTVSMTVGDTYKEHNIEDGFIVRTKIP